MESTDQQLEKLSSISEDEWIGLYRRLLVYASKRYGWICDGIGVTPQDLVQQAIVDTFQGRRHWPRAATQFNEDEKERSLFLFLCGVISSNASHLIEKDRKRPSVEIPQAEDTNTYSEDVSLDPAEVLFKASPGEYSTLISGAISDRQSEYDELIGKLRRSLGDDIELLKIIELLLDDPDLRPREIAVRMRLTMPQMYTAFKRLRRRLHSVSEETSNG